MICQPCRDNGHRECDGLRHPTYCDCQHKPGVAATIARLTETMRAYLAAPVPPWRIGG